MRLSSKSQYGLKACFILAQNYPKRCVSASALEKEIAVSGKYIEKIMRMLSGHGIVAAERGVTGGYKLTRAPQSVTIGDIARALEDNMEIADCITAMCDRCASGAVWRKLYDGINAVLDSMTLQTMLDDSGGVGVCGCGHEDCTCGQVHASPHAAGAGKEAANEAGAEGGRAGCACAACGA